MYSTPKCKANIVKKVTNIEAISARLSIQNTKCESIRSKQKNHRPKSTNEYTPVISKQYSSFIELIKTIDKDRIEAQNVPTGPNHLLNKNINKQWRIKKIGAKEIKVHNTK